MTDAHPNNDKTSFQLVRDALAQRRLVAHYQPNMLLKDGTVFASEALARVQMPAGQALGPGALSDAFRCPDLAPEIDETILDQALNDLAICHRRGHGDLQVSVNVSDASFKQGDYARKLRKALTRHTISPSCVVIEILETVALNCCAGTMASIRELHELGIQLALDDFGTGYATRIYQFGGFPLAR